MVTLAQRHQHDRLARSIGDFVTPGTLLVEVHGGRLPAGGSGCAACSPSGGERTIEQDPAFALRILVDIAIKALSPGSQRSDHGGAGARSLSRPRGDVPRHRTPPPSVCAVRSRRLRPRVVVPGRGAGRRYPRLAVTEIRDYWATSTQVCRRLRALLDSLVATVPPDRRAAVRDELCRLDAAVEAAFPDPVARSRATGSDRQGIGGGSQPGCRQGRRMRLSNPDRDLRSAAGVSV